MGTSTRWPGPGGRTGVSGEWTRLSRRVSSWQPERPGALKKLDSIAADHLSVLHRTMREDPSAFGLYEATCTAGDRLAAHLSINGPHVGTARFAARFTQAVGGEGGTVADAAVRRAAAATMKRLAPPLSAAEEGRTSLSGDLFCLLYQWFFADVVSEFLRAVIAEKIKLVVPVLPGIDPEDHIADWVADHVHGLLPDPCEEAAGHVKAAEDTAAVIEDPASLLPRTARELVPRAAGRALGLISEE